MTASTTGNVTQVLKQGGSSPAEELIPQVSNWSGHKVTTVVFLGMFSALAAAAAVVATLFASYLLAIACAAACVTFALSAILASRIQPSENLLDHIKKLGSELLQKKDPSQANQIIRNLQTQNTLLSQQIESTQKEKASLQQELDATKDKLSKKEQLVRQLKDNSKADKLLVEAKDDLLKAMKTSYRKQFIDILLQLFSPKTNDDKSKIIDNAKDKLIRSCEEQIRENKEKIEELIATIDILNQEIEKLRKPKFRLNKPSSNDDISDVQNLPKKLVETSRNNNDPGSNTNEDKKKIQRSNKQPNEELKLLQEAFDALHESFLEKKKQLSIQERQIKKLKNENRQHKENVSNVALDWNEFQNKYDNLDKQKGIPLEAKAKIDELKNSFSDIIRPLLTTPSELNQNQDDESVPELHINETILPNDDEVAIAMLSSNDETVKKNLEQYLENHGGKTEGLADFLAKKLNETGTSLMSFS